MQSGWLSNNSSSVPSFIRRMVWAARSDQDYPPEDEEAMTLIKKLNAQLSLGYGTSANEQIEWSSISVESLYHFGGL